MNPYEAIFARSSVRTYRMEPLKEEFLRHLNLLFKRLQPLYPEIAVDFLIVDNIGGTAGLKGRFRLEAPYYILLSSELKTGYLENAGYLMQQIALYLTEKGIGSCFQGSLKPGIVLKSKLNGDYCLGLAFGSYHKETDRDKKRTKRLDEKQMVVYKEEVPDSIRRIVRAARWAPSAYNKQPWRLVAYANRIHVFCQKARFREQVLSDKKLLDIGCMLANISQAAEELWLNTTMAKLENISEKKFKKNEYILSVLFQENSF